jgi:glycosyltransferase involved in cell wall biosynthesis
MIPLVSIIIPTFNRAHLISETLNSVIAQTYTNWECIIVDDGSTDNTNELLSNYLNDDRFQFHIRPSDKPKGANSCRNLGFKLSKGQFVKWFDSDDLMRSDLLEVQVKSFTNTIDVSVCKLECYDFVKDISLGESKIYSNNLIQDYLVGKVVFYISGPLWSRGFLEKQKILFDEKISNLDDYDFNLRMLYSSPIIYYNEQALIQYRIDENSLSQEIDKLNFKEIQSEFFALEKHSKLLRNSKLVNHFVVKKYIMGRYKYILRASLINQNPKKYYFLSKLILKQIQLLDFIGVIKTFFGFSIYNFTGIGYKLLK